MEKSSHYTVDILEEAIHKLASQPALIHLNAGRVLVVGDTHGYPEVSLWALELADEADVEAIVFLGDYVDRGPRGVENLELLLEAFISRDNVYLLRGNHEDLKVNLTYGFAKEVYEKRGTSYLELVNSVYQVMPVIAIAGPIILLHGGIPCKKCSIYPEEPFSLEEIEERASRIRANDDLSHLLGADPLISQLLWNDPRGSIEWFLPGPRGRGTYLYGREAWHTFLKRNKLSLLIRGHEVVDGTHIWFADGSQGVINSETDLEKLEYSVITVFSSLYHGSRAAVLLLDLKEDKIEPSFYSVHTSK